MRHYALAFALFVLCCREGLAEDPEKRLTLYRQAVSAYQAKRYAEALVLLEKFVEERLEPEYAAHALYLVSECTEQLGRKHAEDYLWRIVSEYPGTKAEREATSRILKTKGWSFSEIPRLVRPGTRELRHVTRAGFSEPSRYRIYLVPLSAYLEARRRFGRFPHSGAVRFLRSKWQPVGEAELRFQWRGSRDLPAPMIAKPGLYVVEERIRSLSNFHYVDVLSFDFILRFEARKAVVFAVDPWSGKPLDGVSIRLEVHDIALTRVTGKNGLCVVEFPPHDDDPGLLRLVAHRGDEIRALVLGGSITCDAAVYFTTDRPAYRPGERVHFKAVERIWGLDSVRLGRRGDARVEIHEPRGRLLQSSVLEWNDLGSLSGSFQIQNEPPLGWYSVVIRPRDATPRACDALYDDEPWIEHDTGFLVLGYRKPEILGRVEFTEDNPLAGATLRARLKAEYCFGAPVANAEVDWTVSRLEWREDSWRDPWMPRPPVGGPARRGAVQPGVRCRGARDSCAAAQHRTVGHPVGSSERHLAEVSGPPGSCHAWERIAGDRRERIDSGGDSRGAALPGERFSRLRRADGVSVPAGGDCVASARTHWR